MKGKEPEIRTEYRMTKQKRKEKQKEATKQKYIGKIRSDYIFETISMFDAFELSLTDYEL